jgi:hypothetical protein
MSLTCCAFCGHAALGGLDPKLHRVAAQGEVPPYAVANVLMEERTRDSNGRWLACSSCKTKPRVWLPYLVLHSPMYTCTLLSLHLLHVQLLSLVDVSIEMVRKIHDFSHGVLKQSSILDGPLVFWSSFSGECLNKENIPDLLKSLISINIEKNPLFQTCLTMIESPHSNFGIPILPSSAVEQIIGNNKTRGPFQAMNAVDEPLQCVLSTVSFPNQDTIMANADLPKFTAFDVGSLITRDGYLVKRLRTDISGIPVRPFANKIITLETALLPFLFPFGSGRFDSRISLPAYLRSRMKAPFSPLTLYLPYNLLMYQVCKYVDLLNTCKTIAYDKAIHDFRRQNPSASEEDVMKHVRKHKMPASVAGSPAWFRKNLKDLLC